MKSKKLRKLIAIAAICTITLNIAPVTASAEWLQDSQNNWNWTENGIKATGWKQIQGIWYYFDDNGNMKTGWIQTSDSKWYYLNSDGSMKIGWLHDSDGNWYNLAASGEMRIGWILETDGKRYFASSHGAMQTGVSEVEGKIYVFGENGPLLIGKNVLYQEKAFRTDENGVVIEGNLPTNIIRFNKDGVLMPPNLDSNSGKEKTSPIVDIIESSSSSSSTSSSSHSSSSKRAIVSIQGINDINVDKGTELDAAGLPDRVIVKLKNNTTTSAQVTWDGGNPAYDGNIKGSYTFTGTITLPSGVKNPNNMKVSVKVNVDEENTVEEKTISSVEQLSDIDVYNGTELDVAGLPSSVNVKLNDNTTTSAAVAWDVGTPVYDKTKAGIYLFDGTLTLPTDVRNTNNLKASVKVNVEEKTISSVELLNDIDVSIGTELSSAGLSSSVNLKLNDNTTTSAAVAWDVGTPGYDKATAGTYTITGIIQLPNGVKNPSNVTATTLVIVGNKNRAFNKATTASGYTALSEDPSKAVDNNLTSTKWCSTNLGDKWLTVDLGKSYQIGRWYVKHAGDNENAYFITKDFKLQKSDTGQDWKDVDSVTNNTSDVTDRNVPLFRARYVRLYITQAMQDGVYNAARIYEFQVYKDAL